MNALGTASVTPILCDNWPNIIATAYETSRTGQKLPIVIDINSGMNRSGISPFAASKDLQFMELVPQFAEQIELKYLLSHFANAGDPDHPKNKEQVDAIAKIKDQFPYLKISFANSAGMYYLARNNLSHLCDLHRPGLALFGGNPTPGEDNPMENAITLKAAFYSDITPVGQEVGYGGIGKITSENQKIGTIEIGYKEWGALGRFQGTEQKPTLLKSPSNNSSTYMLHLESPDKCKQWLPLNGLPSMDATTIDITGIPRTGTQQHAVLIGNHNPLDNVAKQLGVRPHEVLTSITNDPDRIATIYIDPDNQPDPELARQERLEIA